MAEQGNVNAQFNLGLAYANVEDYKQAVKWYRKAAVREYKQLPDEEYLLDYNGMPDEPKIKTPDVGARAEYAIGSLYEKGLGVLESYTKAGKHYRESARWNYPQGQLAYAKLTLRVLRDDLIEGITKEDRINGYKEAAKFVSKLYENERATDEMHKEAEELWSEYELHKYPY